MKKLSNVQEAIEQAIDGGYPKEGPHYFFIGSGKQGWLESIFTDPLFWQALGRARGWTAYPPERDVIGDSWRDYALEWFKQTRLSNGSEEQFWQSLP